MRVGVVDIGTNSTRLLVCDVEGGKVVRELDRRSVVTRLGEGVDATGALGEAPMERVFATLEQYREAIDEHGCDATTAVLTSAVRDASNGALFTDHVRSAYGLAAQTISGEQEALLTFRGATSDRDLDGVPPVLVIDIGGGSTEMVVGDGAGLRSFASAQAGVVRFTERHLAGDPPAPEELQACAEDAAAVLASHVDEAARGLPRAAIAVAGTATSLAAIHLELEPYDPEKVHGHPLALGEVEELLARLAGMTVAERRELAGLHPDRAPTIVAGAVILVEVLRLFGQDAVEVSEHDILRGAALEAAHPPNG